MIDLGFRRGLLYAGHKIDVIFALRDGGQVSGTATGFLVRRQGGSLLLVTARHVVEPGLAVPKHVGAVLDSVTLAGWDHTAPSAAQQQYVITLGAAPWLPDDPSLDIAAIPVEPPVTWNQVPVTSFVDENLLSDEAEFEDDIRAGDFVAAPGFPETEVIATDRPLLLNGVVASDPRFPISVTRRGGSQSTGVLYQSLSRAGLSGAPLFATQRGMKLGVGLTGPDHRPLRLVGVNAGGFVDSASMPLQFS